jgi:hypothetical protein
MEISAPLTPHFEQFIRDQLASGHFHSEADIIRAALHLLEQECVSQPPSPFQFRSMHHEPAGTPPKSAASHFQENTPQKNHNGLMANSAATAPSGPRSPYGTFSDIRSDISPEDIAEARREMWAAFPHGEP